MVLLEELFDAAAIDGLFYCVVTPWDLCRLICNLVIFMGTLVLALYQSEGDEKQLVVLSVMAFCGLIVICKDAALLNDKRNRKTVAPAPWACGSVLVRRKNYLRPKSRCTFIWTGSVGVFVRM